MNRQPSNEIASLEISSPIELQRLSWKSKYEQICATHVTNGEEENISSDEEGEEEEGKVAMQKPNALVGLLSGYLSSSDESECEDTELSNEVEAFLKEVDAIDNIYKALPKAGRATVSSRKGARTIGWQECFDQSTGYKYYWNVDTNEVTWSMPEEYKRHLEATKQWQQFQAQAEVAAALQKVRQQQQKQQLQQQQALLKQQALEQLNQIKQAEALKAAKREKAKAKKMRKASSAKQSDSEDEKIELITSYGPDSGDESSTDPENKTEDKPAPVKRKKTSIPAKDQVKGADSPPVVMGPQLPPAILKRQRMHSVVLAKNRFVRHDSDTDDAAMPAPPPPPSLSSRDLRRFKANETNRGSRRTPRKEDEDVTTILDRLRSQSKVLKELGGEIPDEVKSTLTDKTGKDPVSKRELNGANCESESKLSKSSESKVDAASSSSQRKQKLELLYKKSQDVQLPDSGKDDTRGLGFSSGKNSYAEQPPGRVKGDKIMFVKAETINLTEEDSKGSKDSPSPESSSTLDIKDLSSLLLDKMKFLSVGKEPVSPVQIWAIQLETLLSAWEAQQLTSTHITAWLQTTSAELERLELTGAPDGWLCQWHRSKKCYSYKNLKTSEVAWEYPQAETARDDADASTIPTGPNRGEEDMEVCTTPPPPPSPPRISRMTPPPPPSMSPTLRSPQKKRKSPSKDSTLPPLPPLPPPTPQEPPPLPPDEPPPPPPPHHQNEPLPPGVDPPETVPAVPVQPVVPQPEFALHVPIPAIHTPVCMIPQLHYPLAYPAVPVVPTPLAASSLQPRLKENPHDLSSELDIFYNDIAQLEPATPHQPPPPPPPPPHPTASTTPPPLPSQPKDPSPPPTQPSSQPPGKSSKREIVEEAHSPVSSTESALKKKKKTKLAPGLALKKKGVSSLVAKWQQVQEDVRRDMKNIED